MSARSDYEVFEASSTKARRLLRQEEFILEVTEALADALQREGITKAHLAKRLGKSKAFVSQILAGGRNLTLRTVADVADALQCRLSVKVCQQQKRNHFTGLEEIDLKGWRDRPSGFGSVVKGDFGRAEHAPGTAA